VNRRPPQLSAFRLVAGLLVPLAAYTVIRLLLGSATGALAITEGVTALWLIAVAIVQRRVEPVAVLSTATVAIALLVYALTGGDPLALKLRRGAVTGTLGVAALASVALGRPFLILVVEHLAKLNPDRQHEIEAKLADPRQRRGLTALSALIGATFALDGATQIALALTVPTGRFVADSTAVRIAVLGTGVVLITSFLRRHTRARG
jgi:hypothetical protein